MLFPRLSLAQKTPLIAAALLLLVGLSISAVAYIEMRHSAYLEATQRLQDLSQLVKPVLGSNSVIGTIAAVARQPALAGLGDKPSESARAAALLALTPRTTTTGPQIFQSEILDSLGNVVLSTNPALDADRGDFPPRIRPGDSASIGRLRLVDGKVGYPLSARIPDHSGHVVVQWRRTGGLQRTGDQLRRLIGNSVIFVVGNRDGSFWSQGDSTIIRRPPVRLDSAQIGIVYARDTAMGPVIASVLPADSISPMTFAIEFPLNSVYAPVAPFFRRMLVITLICLAIGLLAAWWFARRLIAPLEDLTRESDAIAGGSGAAADTGPYRDELWRLRVSFDSMQRQITESHQQMGQKVIERTAELNDALMALQQAQEALVRRERLAMLGQLAGSVGHELRNPLGVMSNAIYYLDMVLQPAPDDVREYLRLLRDQITLSSKIVSDLLDSARVAPAQRRAVSVEDVVTLQAERVARPTSITITTDFSSPPPTAEVDPVQFGQIIFNLLTNAVQAIGDGHGTVSVAAYPAGEQQVELRVTDTGPGIADADLDKIFEPLFTTKARGIGLGLAVSRALARANQGDINVSSAPGSGATFVVIVPAGTA